MTAARIPDALSLERDIVDGLGRMLDAFKTHLRLAVTELGLTAPVAYALSQMDAPMTMGDLAHHLRCDPSFVTSVADELERAGLIERVVDGRDRRIRNLVLTERGRVGHERLHQMLRDMPALQRLTQDEKHQLLRLLRTAVPETEDVIPSRDPCQ